MCMPKHLYTQSYTHNTVNKDQMLDRDPVVWSDLQVSTLELLLSLCILVFVDVTVPSTTELLV